MPVQKAVDKCRESLQLIAKSDDSRGNAAKILISYIQKVQTIDAIEREDQVLAPRLAEPGMNPFNYWLSVEMRWSREQKASVLRSIREELAKNSSEIRRALDLFPDYADKPIPTSELVAAENVLASMLKRFADVISQRDATPTATLLNVWRTPPELKFRSTRLHMVYRALRALGVDASIKDVAKWIDKYCEKDSSDLGFWDPGAELFLEEVVENDTKVKRALENALYSVRKEMKAAEDRAGCKY